MKTGYQIIVNEQREDPEDWTCQHNLNSIYKYSTKIYETKEEAEKKKAWLEKNRSSVSYGGFDFGYCTYEIVECKIRTKISNK